MPNGSIYGLPGNSTIEISIPGAFPVSGSTAIDCDGMLMINTNIAPLPLARAQL